MLTIRLALDRVRRVPAPILLLLIGLLVAACSQQNGGGIGY